MIEGGENNKNKTLSIIIICALLIVLVTIGVVYFFHNETSTTKEISYDDYIYKIRYDFGCESYIYLLKDKSIKIVEITPIVKLVPDCDCMEETGKYNYEEKNILFSKEVKDKVINTFDELSQREKANEFNADNMDLSRYEQRVLMAVTLNEESMLTIEDNTNFDIVTKGTNSKTVLNNNTVNKTVNEIANYLNEKIDNEFNTLNENDNISLKLHLSFIGPYAISFVYTKESQTEVLETKGYNFRYAANIYEIPAGLISNYYESVINEFKKTYNETLPNGWEEILKKNLFINEKWYLEDDSVIFLIPMSLFERENNKIIKIKVPIVGDEF